MHQFQISRLHAFMRSKVESIARAAKRPGVLFAAFDPGNLFQGLPIVPSASEYLSSCVPAASVDLSFARLLGARDIFSENRSAIPSFYCAPFGFVTIATDRCGDALSLDVIDGKVYQLSHEKYESDGIHPGWNADHSAFLPPLSVSRSSIIETSERHWDNLIDFLDDLLTRALEER